MADRFRTYLLDRKQHFVTAQFQVTRRCSEGIPLIPLLVGLLSWGALKFKDFL